ncbi:MAG: hypothetical protein H6509_15160 [Bryobacterales bacterium]|nr:hypothetical protein [Bryobacterales bacterium]
MHAHPALLGEVAAYAVCLGIGLFARKRGRAWAERPFAALTRAIPAPLAAFLVTGVCCALLSVVRPPAPSVHDELSYQLAAETFAAGRLTNPPHPFWRHFETFHVVQQPTYQSRYSPGQGMALAIGQALAGRPIVGVWLSLAAAAAALCWALQAWVPKRWALFGALLPVLRFGALGMWDQERYVYWATTYWGGALPFLGGALLLGATRRLVRRPRTRDGLWFGAGAAALALSRPYEGAVAVSLFAPVAFWAVARARAWRSLWAPAAAVGAALVFLALHNAAVTGSAKQFPYKEYARQYETVPNFRFSPVRAAPPHRHDVFRTYNEGYRTAALRRQNEGLGLDRADALLIQRFFLGPALVPVLLFGLCWRSRWAAYSALILLAGAACHAVTATEVVRPHYFAPFAPALALLVVQGLRLVKTAGRGRLAVAASQAWIATVALTWLLAAGLRGFAFEDNGSLFAAKQAIEQKLGPAPGGHLVFVLYEPAHVVHREWVYNAAAIDASPVVWARSMTPEENRALAAHYPRRKAWLLEPDHDPPRLTPYSDLSPSPE